MVLEQLEEDFKNGVDINRIYKKYGGQSIYIPKINPNFKELVAQEFNGYNHHALAHKYNISLSTVYDVVKKLNPIKERPSLF
jgi:Mor family transcriptional regulator